MREKGISIAEYRGLYNSNKSLSMDSMSMLFLQDGSAIKLVPINQGTAMSWKGMHLRLFTQNFKTWSMAINDGNADVETCPEGLAKTLQPAKTSFKNPLRDTEKSVPKITQNPSNTSTPFPPSYYSFYSPYNHSIYPPHSPGPFPYHQEPHAS